MIIVKKTKSLHKAVRLRFGLHQCERLKTYQCVSFLEKPPTAMKTNAMPQNLISTAAISKLKDGYKKRQSWLLSHYKFVSNLVPC